ncbi:GL10614 [Drosophila persimilis]|uniref:GL10614 n=1 Tax=Drosophila persimilis TaxID=7234 RepID=B4GB08_DROPE|nr:uncharacterized protein LOC6590539 [Drosophila persimilis]EDW32110.1 GL10614 [Drosophila persimilis]
MCTVLILLLLLCTSSRLEPVEGVHNMSLLRSVMSVIARRENWKNTPIFVGHRTKRDDINSLITWLHRAMEVTSHTVDASISARKTKPFGHYNMNADNAVSLFFCHSNQELIWYNLNRSLRRMRPVRLIVALPNQRSGSYKALLSVFKKLWHYQFLNVLVLHNEQIYSYTPYPAVRFYNVDIHSYPLFPPAARNFKGYVVSTPAENDIPRVFLFRDQRTGKRLIRGYGFRTFIEYLNRHNATLQVTNPNQDFGPTSNVNMSRIIQLIMEGQLEISMHPYVDVPEEMGDYSYPLVVARNCLIVPVRNEIPRHMYLLLPLNRWSWLLLLGGVFYISAVLYWINPGHENSAWHQRVGLNFLDGLSRILFISSPTSVQRPSVRYFLVTVQLTILGFVLTSWYNIQLDSFLTALVVGKQVESMEDLIEQQQQVLVKHYEASTLLRHVEPQLINEVASLLVGVNSSEQVSALLSFNRSYAYPFTLERWEFFSLQQQYAFKPIFRFSSACLGSPIIGYPMRSDCHLESSLSMFIMRIQATGLLQHWFVSDFNDAMRAGYVRLLDNVLGFQALDVDTLRLGWFVLGGGWLLSLLVFIFEHLQLNTGRSI